MIENYQRKLVKRSCPVPVTDTLSWVSFLLAVGALYKLYYYYVGDTYQTSLPRASSCLEGLYTTQSEIS